MVENVKLGLLILHAYIHKGKQLQKQIMKLARTNVEGAKGQKFFSKIKAFLIG